MAPRAPLERTRAGGPPRDQGRVLGQVVIGGAGFVLGIVLLLPTVVLFTVGMAPTLVSALLVSRGSGGAGSGVPSFNLAGVVPVLGWLWVNGNDLRSALALLAEPLVWALMYCPAAVGLIVSLVVAPVARLTVERRVAADIAERKARQKALVEEWGLDVVSTALDGVAEPRAKQAAPKPAQRHPSDQEAVSDVDGALATGEEGEVVAAR